MDANKIKKYAKVPHVMPEICYDLVSRVVPGAIVIVCVLWLFKKDTITTKSGSLLVLFIILMAYVIGFTIDTVLNHFLQRWMIGYSWKTVIDTYSAPEGARDLAKRFGADIIFPEGVNDNKDKKDVLLKIDPDQKRNIVESLREHVVTNFAYATWMMPKLNSEAALPRNLGVGLIVVMIMAIYCKFFGWICRDWGLFLRLLPIWVVVEILLVFVRRHRLGRTVTRTVRWFEELQRERSES